MPYKDPEKRRTAIRESQRRHMAKPGNRAAQRVRSNARQAAMKVWYQEVKASLCCERCGEDRPPALDFHHPDPAVKAFTISEHVTKGYGRRRILAEIKKCVVLCANCHRVEHAEQRRAASA